MLCRLLARCGPSPVEFPSERFAAGSAKSLRSRPPLRIPPGILARSARWFVSALVSRLNRKQPKIAPIGRKAAGIAATSSNCSKLLNWHSSRLGWVVGFRGLWIGLFGRWLVAFFPLCLEKSPLGCPCPRKRFHGSASVAYLTWRPRRLPLGAGELNVRVRRHRLRSPLPLVHRRPPIQLLVARLDQAMSLDTSQRRYTRRQRVRNKP